MKSPSNRSRNRTGAPVPRVNVLAAPMWRPTAPLRRARGAGGRGAAAGATGGGARESQGDDGAETERSWTSKWVWINTYRYSLLGDEHPFASYFDVHQGYKVLTHCQMGKLWEHGNMMGYYMGKGWEYHMGIWWEYEQHIFKYGDRNYMILLWWTWIYDYMAIWYLY